MGREIRQVPPNWEHPRYTADNAPHNTLRSRVGEFRPLFDGSYAETKREWLDGLAQREAGTHPDQLDDADVPADFWDWSGGPPRREDYRPDWPEDTATWVQLYETVSGGTPLSPPFATGDELAEWLATHQDFWGYGPVPIETARRFVGLGWTPSAVIRDGVLSTGLGVATVMGRPPRA